MARIRTTREITSLELMSLKTTLASKLRADLAKSMNKPITSIYVRDIMADVDLGLDSEKWDNELAGGLPTVAWTKDWTKELPKNKKIAFYGIINHTDDPQVIGVKFKTGSDGNTVKDIVMFGRVGREEVPAAFFEAVEYEPSETIYVELYNQSGSTIAEGAELLEYLGLVAEKYGDNISAAKE